MSDYEAAEGPDQDWALFAADTLTRRDASQGIGLAVQSYKQAGAELLESINRLVDEYSDQPLAHLPKDQLEKTSMEAGQILSLLDTLPSNQIPTLTGLDTALGFDPVVNVVDPYTVAAMKIGGYGFFDARDEGAYSPGAAALNPEIAMVDAATARTGFFATLASALRGMRNSLSRPSSASGLIDYTVHTDLKEYVLDCSPEYGITWSRFGDKRTSPVTDRLYSGHYYFKGRKERSVRKDTTRHLVSFERTTTRLSW